MDPKGKEEDCCEVLIECRRTDPLLLSENDDKVPVPVYWYNGIPVDVNTQAAAGSNLYLLWAADISNRGEITGFGVDTSTGEIHTYLAVPHRMSDNSIPAVQFDSPSIAPPALPDEMRQRLERGYHRQLQH